MACLPKGHPRGGEPNGQRGAGVSHAASGQVGSRVRPVGGFKEKRRAQVIVTILAEKELTGCRMPSGWLAKGVIYFAVEDPYGPILARAGEVSKAGLEATAYRASQRLGDSTMLGREVVRQRVLEMSLLFLL